MQWIIAGKVESYPLLSHAWFPFGLESADLFALRLLGHDGGVASHFVRLCCGVALAVLLVRRLASESATPLLFSAGILTTPALLVTVGWSWSDVPLVGMVVVLFLATARVIASIQGAEKPRDAVDVVVVGHQYWWEYRYPKWDVVTANELHVPVSDPSHPTPTFMTLLSADTDHSFWVPRLAGKTDLIPNHPNTMWIDPHETGLYLGQCAQYCGTQHAKMLLRVYVDSREDFDRWVEAQRQPARTGAAVSRGRSVFESTACVNCHAVGGTPADGRFGPDLTHFMSRETIASGVAANTPENIRLWIRNPDAIKPGSRMPPMNLADQDVEAVAQYLESLH